MYQKAGANERDDKNGFQLRYLTSRLINIIKHVHASCHKDKTRVESKIKAQTTTTNTENFSSFI